MFEAVIEKPNNQLFQGSLNELKKQSAKDLLEYGDELDEEEQKKAQKKEEEFEEKIDKLKADGYDKNLGITYFSFKKKQQLKAHKKR